MLTIQIHDEQLAQQLQQIAEQENRPVEDVLRALVAQYPGQQVAKTGRSAKNEAVQRIRHKAYSKARHYWQSVGDVAKSELSDQELDDQFGYFDAQGIPRLKSELESLDSVAGSLAYAAKLAREANIRTSAPVDVAAADEILNNEYADYLYNRLRGVDASQ